MGRDYAKPTPKRKRGATKRSQRSFPTAVLFIVGSIVLGFTGFLYYLKSDSTPSTTANTEKTATQKLAEPTIKEPEVPKYTFHDYLNEKQVVIPEEELKSKEAQVSMHYTMPCGSFRSNEMADSLRAKIAFLGYESKVVPVDAESGRWYRVQLGPYVSKRKAESIRHRLQENDINDCKIWGQKL